MSKFLKVGCTGLALVTLLAFALPSIRYVPRDGGRSRCLNNLKNLALALHNYHSEFGTLPPAYTTDENGKPLHSWRTLILPFIDEDDLYGSIDLTKPWDDPANAHAREAMPWVYQCRMADLPENHTTYLAIVGADRCMHPTEARAFEDISDFVDHPSLMLIEAEPGQAVHWMSPADLTGPLKRTGVHGGVIPVVLSDGSARVLDQSVDAEVVNQLLRINDRRPVYPGF